MEKERGVERCKQCGGPGYHDKLEDGRWRYVCLRCQAPGPIADQSLTALAVWNAEQRA